jgi:hypothetical protein
MDVANKRCKVLERTVSEWMYGDTSLGNVRG